MMKRFLHSELWWFYSEIVHQTLFLDILSHGVLESIAQLLTAAAAATEENKSLAAFCVAILFSIINMVWHKPEEKAEPPKKAKKKGNSVQKRIPPARDKRGRFAKVDKKNRRM